MSKASDRVALLAIEAALKMKEADLEHLKYRTNQQIEGLQHKAAVLDRALRIGSGEHGICTGEGQQQVYDGLIAQAELELKAEARKDLEEEDGP